VLFVRGVYFEQVLCRCLLVDFDVVFSVFRRARYTEKSERLATPVLVLRSV